MIRCRENRGMEVNLLPKPVPHSSSCNGLCHGAGDPKEAGCRTKCVAFSCAISYSTFTYTEFDFLFSLATAITCFCNIVEEFDSKGQPVTDLTRHTPLGSEAQPPAPVARRCHGCHCPAPGQAAGRQWPHTRHPLLRAYVWPPRSSPQLKTSISQDGHDMRPWETL